MDNNNIIHQVFPGTCINVQGAMQVKAIIISNLFQLVVKKANDNPFIFNFDQIVNDTTDLIQYNYRNSTRFNKFQIGNQ